MLLLHIITQYDLMSHISHKSHYHIEYRIL